MAELENHWVVRDGQRRFIRWRNSLLRRADGEVSDVIAAGIDITDRFEAEATVKRLNEELAQRAQQLLSKNAELEAFAYSVSHDLSTPLQIVTSFASALLEIYGERLGEEGRDWHADAASKSVLCAGQWCWI